MPRMKRKNIKRLPPIDLNLDDPAQKEVWDYYQLLTKTGDAAEWIRQSLMPSLGMPPVVRHKPAKPDVKPATTRPAPIIPSRPVPKITVEDDDLHYEDLNE